MSEIVKWTSICEFVTMVFLPNMEKRETAMSSSRVVEGFKVTKNVVHPESKHCAGHRWMDSSGHSEANTKRCRDGFGKKNRVFF